MLAYSNRRVCVCPSPFFSWLCLCLAFHLVVAFVLFNASMRLCRSRRSYACLYRWLSLPLSSLLLCCCVVWWRTFWLFAIISCLLLQHIHVFSVPVSVTHTNNALHSRCSRRATIDMSHTFVPRVCLLHTFLCHPRILNTTVMSAAYGVSLSLLRPLLLELLLPSKSTTFVSIGWHKLRTAQTVHTLIERKQLRSRHFYRSHFTSSAWGREENHVPTTMQQRNNFWLLFPFSENCKESCVLLNIWMRISFR